MRIGQKHTQEWKEKVKKIHADRPVEKEQLRRLKISRHFKGRASPKKGIKTKRHTLESIAKMKAKKKGVVFTIEHRKKLSESHKGKIPSNKGRPSKIRGSLHPLWNGRQTLKRQIRLCFEYRQWRADCMTRDSFTCQFCNTKGGDLEVDHIKRFATILNENEIKTFEEAINCSELWNINNGRTLCKACHKKVTFGYEN